MNAVFGALLIVVLIYPGIIARLAYISGIGRLNQQPVSPGVSAASPLAGFSANVSRNKFRIFRQAVWEQIIASLLPALFVHLATLLVLQLLWFTPRPGFLLIYKILSSSPLSTLEFEQTAKSLIWFLAYFLGTLLVAMGLGLLFRAAVRRLYLDLRIRLLRFSNDWDYLLSGRVLGAGEKTLDLIWIYALCETKEQTIIYDGYLRDYELSEATDGLDRLVLYDVSKRAFSKRIVSAKQTVVAGPTIPASETGQNDKSFQYEKVTDIKK